MTSVELFLALGAAIWLIGLHGLLIRRHPLRRIIAINVMSSGVFMIMIALARRTEPADPVMHALVVTGLVVAVSATAFALRLAASRPAEQARARERKQE